MSRSGSSRQRRRPRQTHRLTWRHARLEITHTRDYLEKGHDHIEVAVKAPKGAPIPITETGYRSHFLPASEIESAGGVVPFVAAWLDREATTKAWQQIEFRWRQLELELLPSEPAHRPVARKSAPTRRRRPGQGSA